LNATLFKEAWKLENRISKVMQNEDTTSEVFEWQMLCAAIVALTYVMGCFIINDMIFDKSNFSRVKKL